MKVTIYTDGGADPNPGAGGWAAILHAGGREKVISGSEPHTTNNRMELQAAISAFQALTRPSEVEFHTDSEYLRKGITTWISNWAASGWKRKGKPVANADLWQILNELVKEHDVDWHWVKGHGSDPLNRRADALARKARLDGAYVAPLPDNVARIFVKGTCRGNPGPGTWAVVLEFGGDTEQFSGTVDKTTNNRMELTAAIVGISKIPENEAVQVITASDYLFQGATRWIYGWRDRNWTKRDGKPVSNKDLWIELDNLQSNREVGWHSAKFYSKSPPAGLEEVKRLANEAKKLL
ncbi:MAG: ribonuclease HI [Candidatus Promineifilaceae bacterium]